MLNYYKNRFKKSNDILSNTILFTPTLIHKYNQYFINLYNSSTLNTIKSLQNINSYNLDKINYIKSNSTKLIDLQLSSSNQNKIDFNNNIFTYDSIIFDNYLVFNILPEIQFSTINTSAFKIYSNNKTTIPVLNSTSLQPIIDVSSISSSLYNTHTLQILIEVTSENTLNKTIYTFNASRLINKSNNNYIKYIKTQTNHNNKINNTSIINNINNNNQTYYLYYDTHNLIQELRSFIFEIQNDNIFSTSSLQFSNIKNNTISSNSFYKNYNIQTYSDTVPVSINITRKTLLL